MKAIPVNDVFMNDNGLHKIFKIDLGVAGSLEIVVPLNNGNDSQECKIFFLCKNSNNTRTENRMYLQGNKRVKSEILRIISEINCEKLDEI